jgi:hypothetical protein
MHMQHRVLVDAMLGKNVFGGGGSFGTNGALSRSDERCEVLQYGLSGVTDISRTSHWCVDPLCWF